MNVLKLANRFYLGDGVYVANDGYHLWLYTTDGVNVLNQIALDSETLSNFVTFIKARCDINDAMEDERE